MNQQEENLRKLAKAIDDTLTEDYNQRMGFFIVVAPFEEGEGISDYIGNASREESIRWMRETADRLERNQTIPATEGNA